MTSPYNTFHVYLDYPPADDLDTASEHPQVPHKIGSDYSGLEERVVHFIHVEENETLAPNGIQMTTLQLPPLEGTGV